MDRQIDRQIDRHQKVYMCTVSRKDLRLCLLRDMQSRDRQQTVDSRQQTVDSRHQISSSNLAYLAQTYRHPYLPSSKTSCFFLFFFQIHHYIQKRKERKGRDEVKFIGLSQGRVSLLLVLVLVLVLVLRLGLN